MKERGGGWNANFFALHVSDPNIENENFLINDIENNLWLYNLISTNHAKKYSWNFFIKSIKAWDEKLLDKYCTNSA